jgi:hypothetical protein
MSISAQEALRQLSEPFWFRVGRDSASVYAERKRWLFRRVEAIELVGRRSVMRSVSIDFEIPDDLPDLANRPAKGTVLQAARAAA